MMCTGAANGAMRGLQHVQQRLVHARWLLLLLVHDCHNTCLSHFSAGMAEEH
jgi:hypothetical protein